MLDNRLTGTVHNARRDLHAADGLVGRNAEHDIGHHILQHAAQTAGTRFALDAAVAHLNAAKNDRVINRPPDKFEEYTGPLSQAIVRGLSDGTVNPEANIKQLYYNAYDSILGLMQRLTVGVPSVRELDARERLYAMCEMFTRAFAAKNVEI